MLIISLLRKLDTLIDIFLTEHDVPIRPKEPVDPRGVVDAIMDRPLQWVNWRDLPLDARRTWSNDAKAVLSNQAFIALCGSIDKNGQPTNGELAKDIIEHIGRYSKDHAETRDMRMTLNGIELIRDRLSEMVIDEYQPSNEEPNAAV